MLILERLEDKYEIHGFTPEHNDGILTLLGVEKRGAHVGTVLHGLPVTPPHPERADNPPAGLFRWHYLQCVIRKFGHSQYKTLANISFSELALPMVRDSNEEETDSDGLGPTAAWDQGRAGYRELESEQAQNERISSSASTVGR
ncbi:hypothetical protein C8J57DRAFT_1731068 [Mycena rebaudengoi]|nr:hypothetical protein C8J57DRAFT_1731068 [Mycena rebaudengoi]